MWREGSHREHRASCKIAIVHSLEVEKQATYLALGGWKHNIFDLAKGGVDRIEHNDFQRDEDDNFQRIEHVHIWLNVHDV